MGKLQTLDLSYLEINDFLVSHNQYYLDLLKSLEENNLDKNIKAFYQLSSYIINSPLIDNEKTINTFVQNVKSNLAYSNENKVYNVIFKKNEWTEKYDFGLKLNINPLNKETLIPLYRPEQINNNLSSKTYVNTIKEQLLKIFGEENEFNQLTSFFQRGEQIKLKFLEISNFLSKEKVTFFEQYFSYLILNHSAFLKNIFNVINDTFVTNPELQERLY